MTRQIVLLRPPASMVERRQPLLQNEDYSSRGGARKVKFAEMAGGTAADCAAVCCCPCGLVYLMILAVYKVPARLCRKALRRKRRLKLKKQGLLPRRKCGCEDQEFQIQPITGVVAMLEALEETKMKNNKEIIELDKEMWGKFYGAGFWRSSSQRSEIST